MTSTSSLSAHTLGANDPRVLRSSSRGRTPRRRPRSRGTRRPQVSPKPAPIAPHTAHASIPCLWPSRTFLRRARSSS